MKKLSGIACLLLLLMHFNPLTSHGQGIVWDTAYGAQFAGDYGPNSVRGVIAFPDNILVLSVGVEFDTLDGFGRGRVWLSSFDYQGHQRWQKRLPDRGAEFPAIAKITDTSFALACSYSNPLGAPGRLQHRGIRLRLFNLEARELWHWSINENLPYIASVQALKAMPGGRIALGCNRTDTVGTIRLERELRVFTPDGLIEKYLRVTDEPHRIFNNTLSPLPGGRWRTLSYDLANRRFAVILDSNWNVVRRDTMARAWRRAESSETLAATSDGGYLFITIASFQDTGWGYVERHDGQNRLLWAREMPTGGYYYGTVETLTDGGFIWLRDSLGTFTNPSDYWVFFERESEDGSILWRVQMPRSFEKYVYSDAVLDGTGGGIVGGYRYSDLTGNQAYLAYVNNLGYPYDPLASKPSIVSEKGILKAWPNPATSQIRIKGKPLAPVLLYSIDGRHLHATRLDGNGEGLVQIGHLPKGVYLLRCGEAVQRVVRE